MWAIKFINLVAVQGHFTSSAWYRWLQPLGFSLCFLHPSVAFCLKLKESMVNITAEVFPTQSTETLLYLREYLCISYLTPLIKCEHVLCCMCSTTDNLNLHHKFLLNDYVLMQNKSIIRILKPTSPHVNCLKQSVRYILQLDQSDVDMYVVFIF